jgi:hypothetical protein
MRLYEISKSLNPFDTSDVSSLPVYISNYFNNERYFNKEKNIKIRIVNMTPAQYIHDAESLLTKQYGTKTVSRQTTGADKIRKYVDLMQSGVKFPLPYISYIDNLQDGLHRVEAAMLLGITTIPVLVVEFFQPK